MEKLQKTVADFFQPRAAKACDDAMPPKRGTKRSPGESIDLTQSPIPKCKSTSKAVTQTPRGPFQPAIIDEQFSDITIELLDRQLRCHKFILCSYSTVLRSMLTGSFKEGQAGFNTLALKDDDPEAFQIMVERFYRASKPNRIELSREIKMQAPIYYQRLWVVADKFDSVYIKKICTSAFERSFKELKADVVVEQYSIALDHYADNSSVPGYHWARDVILQSLFANLSRLIEMPAFFTMIGQHTVLNAAIIKVLFDSLNRNKVQSKNAENHPNALDEMYGDLVVKQEFAELE